MHRRITVHDVSPQNKKSTAGLYEVALLHLCLVISSRPDLHKRTEQLCAARMCTSRG